MVLTECLKIVKKMCMARILVVGIKLSTGGKFNVKLQIVSRAAFEKNYLLGNKKQALMSQNSISQIFGLIMKLFCLPAGRQARCAT